ncbi:DUF429 domain-containing protein [uncultured Jatrophihabitans sp.]|uniref:DUF429 domain-containing protein n=1 Tax=uncultured Jatrophihabitans sp. TaxID=1610747 RepID=UPI0035CC8302
MSTVVGIDLAASPATTAVAVLDGQRVELVEVGADDERIVALSADTRKIGIDCPLGWPREFVRFVDAHSLGRPVAPAGTIAGRVPLAYRVTDRWVAAHRPPLRPLSVSADRIAHAAFRCAGLLAQWGATDRSGAGLVVEVYPAGSLHAWGLPYRGYKGTTGRAVRDRLVDVLGGVVDLGAHEVLCRRSDHALDAVLSALSARSVLLGMSLGPPEDLLDDARLEGWITLPAGRLEELASNST